MSWTVYCHTHVESGRRYIGLTKQTVERRWAEHVSKAKSAKGGRWHFPNAIRKYGKDAFSHEILTVCSSLEEANAYEAYFINLFRTCDPLFGFNLAQGGEHKPHPIRKNPWDDPGYRAQQMRRQFGFTPEVQAKIRAIESTPEFRMRASLASKEVHSRPEVKAKMSAASKGRKLNPDHRAIALEALHSPAARAASKAAMNTPESRVKRSLAAKKALANPETRKKISAGVSAAKAGKPYSLERRANMRKKFGTPQMRRKLSEAASRYWSTHSVSAETRGKLRATFLGRSHTDDAKAKVSSFQQSIKQQKMKYVLLDGAITHKLCRVHGMIPIADCWVGKYSNGEPRVMCKQCTTRKVRNPEPFG